MAFYSSVTSTQAQQRIARAIGGEGDASILSAAKDALLAAFSEWNRVNWSWLMTTASDIAVVAGTAEYNLPADFKAFYNVRLTGPADRPLQYIDWREYDRKRWDQTSNSLPTHYTYRPPGGAVTVARVRLLPTPDANDTLSVKYYRQMIAPTVDANALDIPYIYENGPIFLAKSLFLADRDAENARTGFWHQRAMTVQQDAEADDQHQPDREERFIPAAEHGRPVFDATHPYYYLEPPD